jgi:hypothetical protein
LTSFKLQGYAWVGNRPAYFMSKAEKEIETAAPTTQDYSMDDDLLKDLK